MENRGQAAYIAPQQQSFSGDGIIATTYSDDYITRGDCYNIVSRQTIASGATVKNVLDLTGVSSSRFIFVLPVSITSSGGYIKADTYAISSYTGGTAKAFVNANSTSNRTAQSVYKYGITSSDAKGADVREYVVGGGSNPASSRGGAASGANALILNNTKKICFEMTNTTTGSVDVSVALVVYEIQAK